MVRRISSGSPFEAKIGYSRAVVDGDRIYVSGTTGYDYKTMTMPEDAGQQARNALHTIEEALEQAGSSLKDVVRVRYYITDMAWYDALVEVAGETFRDIRPMAPTHVLVIPKKHIAAIHDLEPAHAETIGQVMVAARRVADQEGLTKDGYRLVINDGDAAGQTVHHIHVHVLGGRTLSWPPG